MYRTSTAITTTGALVRAAVDTGGRTSDDLTLEITIDIEDLLALLTQDEARAAGGMVAGHNLVFGVGITSGGALIGASTARFPEGQLLSRVGVPDQARAALRARAQS